jgi:hypothetical protein
MGMITGNPAVLDCDKSIFGDDAAVYRLERRIESDEEKIKLMHRHLMTVIVARTYFVYVGCTE